MYETALFIHIVSAIGLFSGIIVLLSAFAGLRQTTSLAQAQGVLTTTRRVRLLFVPSILLLLISGLYMMGVIAQKHEPIGWIIVALASLVLLGILASLVGDKETKNLQKQLIESKGELPEALRVKAQDHRANEPLVYALCVALGIVALMVFKPDVTTSVITILGTLAAAFVATTFYSPKVS
jgi:cell division protein FtsW (lipid II flippase)